MTNINAKLSCIDTFSENYRSDFIFSRTMSTTNVSEGLADEFKSWWHGRPVFIDAPTGSGKSSWVINNLLAYVMETGGQMLIVSNRIAINTQYKQLILRAVAPSLIKKYTDFGLQETNQFEGIPVVFSSYQGLPGLLKHGVSFTYAVFDEVHFFCSDSGFSRDTWALLKQLPKTFVNAVRIYMTATPWSVQNLVAKAEEEYKLPIGERIILTSGGVIFFPGMLMYRFPSLPRNYKLRMLPSEVRDNACSKTLLDLIKNSPSTEKWIVFVNSKEIGKKLAKSLGGIAAYLDAEHKSGPVWGELTTKAKFSARVLVTTAVTDCGVNINDPAVKHVVLSSTDHVQFIQELGRKRLKEGETLNVYVPDLSPQQWRKLNAKNEQLIQLVDDVSQHPERRCTQRFSLWYDGDREARCLITIDGNGNLQINLCAKQVVYQRALFYQELEDQWASGEKHPFLRIVARWLELPESALADALEGNSEAAFRHFLDENCGRPLEGEEAQRIFSNKFRELYTAAFGPRETGSRRKDPWGAGIIQTELDRQEIPYELTAQKGVWLLTKKEEEVSSNV